MSTTTTTHLRCRPHASWLTGVLAAAAVIGGTAGAADAQAAVPTAPSLDYREWAIGVPPTTHTIGDCRVSVGPVRDPWVAFPLYRKIAGAQVHCSTRKDRITAYVYLQKWENGRWVQKGTRGYGVLFTSTGSGVLKKGSQPVCGGRGAYWRTLAQVQLGSGGAWWNVPSAATLDSFGC